MAKKKISKKVVKDKNKPFKGEYLVIAESKNQADNIAERADKKTPRLYINLPKKTSTASANRFFRPQRRITPKPPRIK